jgi:hypothetical protein
MTTVYQFTAIFTKLGVPTFPAVDATIAITDDANNILVAAGTATTKITNQAGAYHYSFTGSDNLACWAMFYANDATMDQEYLAAYPEVDITTASTGVPTTSGVYATLAEFKAWYKTRGGDDKADLSDDATINSVLEATSRYIDNEVGRRFWTTSSDETRYFPVEPTYTHSSQSEEVEVGDLLSATSVAVDYDEDRNYTALTVTTDYEFEPVNAALDGWPYSSLVLAPQTTNYFPTTRNGVQVVGKWGFPAVPTDIKNLCLAMTLNIYSERSGQTSPGNITITAAGVVIRPQDVPAWGKRVLLKYSAI